MSSKAEDFDVRYRDAGTAGHGRPAADGGYGGNAGDIDYDLGYDSTGWDTQGFRRPEAGFGDSPEADLSRAADRGGVGTAVRPEHGRASRGRHDGSHPRVEDPTESTQLNWDNEATGSLLTPELPAREIFLLWQAGRTHSPLAAHAIELARSAAAGLTD